MINDNKILLMIFTTPKCKKCCKLMEDIFSIENDFLENVEVAIVDALADDKQDFCDKHNVDELPHVKILDVNNKIIFNKCGSVIVEEISQAISKNIS